MSLLGYRLRRAAQKEMLYGGVRLQHLVQSPTPIKYTKSQVLPLPTPREEMEDMGLEYEWIGFRQLPVNVGVKARHAMAVIRSKDVLQRYRNAQSKFHPSPKDLSIFPKEPLPAIGFNGARAFMPFQIVKPVSEMYNPSVRGSGARSSLGALKMELLDGKGFGWKKKSRYLWQQDVETKGFRPKRFF